MEEHVDDLATVLDTVGAERVALFGMGGAAPIAAMFAATYPARTEALIIHGGSAKTARADDYPGGWDADVWSGLVRAAVENHGVSSILPVLAPSVAGDERVGAWSLRAQRMASSPGGVMALLQQSWETDARHLLALIQAPTLVLHPAASFLPIETGQDFAARIPGARWVEITGGEMMPFFGGAESVLQEVQEFLTGEREATEPDRVLATILFTDIVGSTQRAVSLGDRRWHDLLDAHDVVVRGQLSRFRGREIKTTGDGFVASFDGPARAIRCAKAVVDAVCSLGIEIRAGLHTGECEVRGDDLGGVAVHIAARVGALANPSEVVVSGTVKDLVAGSGIAFVDRGEHELKGVPGTWRLYTVET
jgi:class 3 adenylate cyclase